MAHDSLTAYSDVLIMSSCRKKSRVVQSKMKIEFCFEDYPQIFTPGAPIEHRDFLVGRAQELLDLHRAITRPGLNPIVVGDRGVGKTSLACHAFSDLHFQRINISCHPDMSFDELAKKVLHEMGFDVHTTEVIQESEKKIGGSALPFGVGVSGESSKAESVKKSDLGSQVIDPETLFRMIKESGKQVLVILDEYDRVRTKSQEFHSSIASLIKNFGDHHWESGSRLVVVGVAQSAQALLGEHESIERNAREIFLRPLRNADVNDFLSVAEEKLQFQFDYDAKKDIVKRSSGYPYYVHLVSLAAIDSMVERDSNARKVSLQDYNNGLTKAVSQAYRSELMKYRHIIDKLTTDETNLIFELVTESEFRHNSPRYGQHVVVTRAELQKRMLTQNIMTMADFDHAWVQLQQKYRFIHVSRNNDEIKFADPLMQPFLSALFSVRKVKKASKHQLSLFDEIP
jgi:AAA+ ATPase superfamily predicted ATPase